MIRNNQNRRRRGGGGNGPRPQQMNGGGNSYGNRLDNRQRGNASQLLEKYKAMARDAQQAGDRVAAEYYLQYADHYYRVLGDYRERQPEQNRQRGANFYDDADGNGFDGDRDDGDDGEGSDGDRPQEYRGEVQNGQGQAMRPDSRGPQANDDAGDYRRERNDDRRGPRDNGPREGGQRDNGQRDNSQRDGAQRDGGPRDFGRRDAAAPEAAARDSGVRDNGGRDGAPGERFVRDGGQRAPRREYSADRPRGEWQNDRVGRDAVRPDRDGGRDGFRADAAREAPRDGQRFDGDRNERRPATARPLPEPRDPSPASEAPAAGLIAGLPGPATLPADAGPAAAPADAALSLAATDAGDAAPAPRRRGRPRKVVTETPAEA